MGRVLLINRKIFQFIERGYNSPFESMSMCCRHAGGFPGLHGYEAGNLTHQTLCDLKGFVNVGLGGAFFGFEKSYRIRQSMS